MGPLKVHWPGPDGFAHLRSTGDASVSEARMVWRLGSSQQDVPVRVAVALAPYSAVTSQATLQAPGVPLATRSSVGASSGTPVVAPRSRIALWNRGLGLCFWAG